nr:RNA-directed DNA polymerase, eukaryota [Tanacetum cinerariifolium]
MYDRWVWSLEGSGDFSVSSVRKLIDDVLLPEVTTKIRGMDIESILCHMCGNVVESSMHPFFTCRFSTELMRKIYRWWDIDYMKITSYEEWLDWILNPRLSLKHKQILEDTCYVLWRPVRAGSEHQQMVDLNSLLESVSLSQSHDRWFCDLTCDGELRVKEVMENFGSKRIARLLQDKFKANELAKDKIQAKEVPRFENHVPPHYSSEGLDAIIYAARNGVSFVIVFVRILVDINTCADI